MRWGPAVIALLVLVAGAGVASAQDGTADVRTWAGQTLRLTSPSLEVSYTVIPPPPPGVTAAPTTTTNTPTGITGAATTVNTQAGAVRPIEGYVAPQTVDSKQGRRQQSTITIARGGLEMRVPLANVTTMTFVREPVKSTLPPPLGDQQYRYGTTLDLADGSQVTGDYVNLGTAVLRGTTPQGTVAIPWQDIQTLRFQR